MSDPTEEHEVVRFDGVVVHRDPVVTGLAWIDELIEATQNWVLEAVGLIAPSAELRQVAEWARRGYRADVCEIDGQPVDPRTLRAPTDIVDAIDQLVDEQLAGGPVDDYRADRYDRCPHCDRHWHGLPLTQRVADMYAARRFDEDYRVDTDDTPVICEGSDFIGPMKPPSAPKNTPGQMYVEVHAGVQYLTWTGITADGETANLMIPITEGEPGLGAAFTHHLLGLPEWP